MKGNAWLSLDEAAEFLKTDRGEIEEMMRQRLIPYTLLPISKSPLFSTDRLDRWLRDQEILPQAESGSSGITRETLKKMIIQRLHLKASDTTRYTNLYVGTRVCAQLHEPTERKKDAYDGICLAIPEAWCTVTSSGEGVPKVEFLVDMDIRDLHGYWKANKDWLDGNGQRFTRFRAMAYHIPLELAADPSHPGWSEVDKLLGYAQRNLEEDEGSSVVLNATDTGGGLDILTKCRPH